MWIQSTTSELLERLRERIASLERPADRSEQSVISTGCPALDRVLPFEGVRHGSLTEWLSEQPGSGAESLALFLTREACRDRGVVVLLDRQKEIYPPAVVAGGIDAERLIVVHPETEADELWAADQALRSRAAGAVWLWRERLRPHDYRRLRLAAECGGAVGVLLRPARVLGQATWADVQMLVRPREAEDRGQKTEDRKARGQRTEDGGQKRSYLSSVLCPLSSASRRLQVEVTRCRGHGDPQIVEVELDDVSGALRAVGPHETLRVSVSPRLADSAAARRATGTEGPRRGGVSARRPG
jgi:protein ImuA